MARVTCAISGIRFECSYFEHLSIPHTEGYIHPVFALSHKQLLPIYSAHTRGELTSNDSYLLFTALLHSTGKIQWLYPASLNPNEPETKQVIENNISQLVQIIAKTNAIRHPHFSQPSFNVTYENSDLAQIKNWIRAWQENIADFYYGKADDKAKNELQIVENRLSKLILSGDSPKSFSHVIANWADKAGEFPEDKADLYKSTIASCFSVNKMFATPLALLKEIKDFCECNIDVGSIHFHTLSQVLNEGISRHVDYLGGTNTPLGYTLLSPTDSSIGISKQAELKNMAELATLAAKAPDSEPKAEDYPTSLAFLKARLAYRVSQNAAKEEKKAEILLAEQLIDNGEAL